MTRYLAKELGPRRITANVVAPGPVQTDLYESSGCGYADRETPHPPAWACTTPDRVAEKTIRAIYRNQALSLVGVAAYVLYYAKRFAPSIFYAMHSIGRAKNLRNKLKKSAAMRKSAEQHNRAA